MKSEKRRQAQLEPSLDHICSTFLMPTTLEEIINLKLLVNQEQALCVNIHVCAFMSLCVSVCVCVCIIYLFLCFSLLVCFLWFFGCCFLCLFLPLHVYIL